MYTRLLLPGDKKGAKLTAKELDSISDSFDESLLSRLWGLSPASVSLPWLSSAVGVVTFAHSSVKSLIYELKVDGGGDSLSSLYLDNSLKVLDVCNCISSEIQGLCLRLLNLRIAIELLRSDANPSEEEIHQAMDLLTDSKGEGGYVKSAGDIEELIRDLAASIGMSAPWWKVSPVERVVHRAICAVGFVTAFVAGVISSALRTSSGSRAVVWVRIPKEFPWGGSIRAIESAVITESGRGEERARKLQVLKELDHMEACARHVLEVIGEVAASGGGEEIVGRLRVAVVGLEKANEAMSEGLCRLREGVNELFRTATGTRKEMADELTASMRKSPLPKKPQKPGKSN